MTVHDLKTVQPWFDYGYSGKKPFEVRKNDRNFRTGDLLVLHEWDPETKEYAGRSKPFEITMVLTDEDVAGIQAGYCVMAIRALGGDDAQ